MEQSMLKPVISLLMLISIIAASASAAKLDKTEKTIAFVNVLKNKQVPKDADIKSQAILEAEESVARPVVFEIINANLDEKSILRLSKFVTKPNSVGFNSKSGKYFYNDVDAQRIPLAATDGKSLLALQLKAEKMVGNLLGADASRFAFANTETDYVLNKGDSVPRISRMTYRFTRKLNGRHIIDNSSYVRVSFSGDTELSGFEIVNPELKPIETVKHLIKLSATDARLEDYASRKNTATKNGMEGLENVGVKTILAETGIDSYLSKKVGSKLVLLPNVSFFSEYQLENGESFENWAHFCLDADQTPNIEKSMIEDSGR